MTWHGRTWYDMNLNDMTALSHTQQQWQQASMNDSLPLLQHLFLFLIFQLPNSLYDWFHCSTQTVVGELTEVGQRLVVAVGGLGGKGNAALRTKGAWYRVAVLHYHCAESVFERGCDIQMVCLWPSYSLPACLHAICCIVFLTRLLAQPLLLLLLILILLLLPLDHSLILCTAALPVCVDNRWEVECKAAPRRREEMAQARVEVSSWCRPCRGAECRWDQDYDVIEESFVIGRVRAKWWD